jgi:biotin--protein ligase
VYGSEAGARAISIEVNKMAFASKDDTKSVPDSFYSYYNGGGVFVDAGTLSSRGVEVLAKFADPLEVDAGQGNVKAAIVHCSVGQGAAILTGPHPEYDKDHVPR